MQEDLASRIMTYETVLEEAYGPQTFRIVRYSWQTIREKQGFRRPVTATRRQFWINGGCVSADTFFTIRKQAKLENVLLTT